MGAAKRESDAKRRALANAASRLIEEWNLSPSDGLMLLGLSCTEDQLLERFAHGEPMPDRRDVLDRIGHLLAIYKGLELLFPENPDVRSAWMRSPNRQFSGAAPIEIVRADGFVGLLDVRKVLDAAIFR